MARPISFGAIRIGLGSEPAADPQPASAETPFRIAVLGDFSGRGSRGRRDLANQRPVRVDRDNLEQLLGQLGTELHLRLGSADGPQLVLRFKELDDFRPEAVVRQSETLQQLQDLRQRLGHPNTFAAAAAELQKMTGAAPAAAPPPRPDMGPAAAPASPARPATPPEDLLEAVLAQTAGREEAPAALPGGGDWNAFLRQAAAAHVVPKEAPGQAESIAQVDALAGSLLRSVLHHPDFQALEAAWRGLDFLVRRLDTDEGLRLFLLDVTRDELAADLMSADDLTKTATYRLLVERSTGTAGGQPWAVLLGHYTFGPARQDAELLGRLALVAGRAGAPLLAAASPALLGCRSLAAMPDPDDWNQPVAAEDDETWAVLRQLPEAAYLGLALPRFLLRLPYGKDTSPVEVFDFEEMPGEPEHERYLWGNPAVVCAYLLGAAFSREGWELRPGSVQDVAGLPLHAYRAGGESEVKPCAEVLLGPRAVERIRAAGIIPLLSVEGSDSISVGSFRSLAEPETPLMGRWG